MATRVSIWLADSVTASAIVLGTMVPAFAEELYPGNRPWDFSTQNRAGIAALIEQKKNGTLGGSNGQVASGGGGCGGSAGNSTAIGNYTCIIINDSTAAIELLQDEDGGQTASTQTQTSGGDMSDVLQDLSN